MTTTPQPTRQPRGCLATLAVFLVMIGIVGGGFIAQDALADVPIGPINVGYNVHIQPAQGWEFGGRTEDGNTILLSRGTGSLAVTVFPTANSAHELAKLRDEWLATGTVTASDIAPVTGVRSDRQVLRFGYSGNFPEIAASVEGEVYALDGNNVGVVYDSWAGMGQYVSVRDDVVAMISTTVLP